MSWHVQEPTMDAYVDGRIDDAVAFSLEAHVLACSQCRDALSARDDTDRHERVWTALRAEIDRPRVGIVERGLTAVGIREDVARLLAATPALRASWLAAVAATLAFAVIASRAVAGDILPFLALAPLIPLAGVAAAFGKPADPAWELGLSTPTGGFTLMLIRSTAVLAVSAVLAGLAAVALPDAGWSAAAWLLPALALTVLTLVASSTRLSATGAAGLVGGAWLVVVTVADRLADRPLAVFGPGAQVAFAAIAALAGTVLAARHLSFERPTRI
jgi:hypothetical protein